MFLKYEFWICLAVYCYIIWNQAVYLKTLYFIHLLESGSYKGFLFKTMGYDKQNLWLGNLLKIVTDGRLFGIVGLCFIDFIDVLPKHWVVFIPVNILWMVEVAEDEDCSFSCLLVIHWVHQLFPQYLHFHPLVTSRFQFWNVLQQKGYGSLQCSH